MQGRPENGTVVNDLLLQLERSGLAESIRSAIWLYPAIEIAHIAGFVILVGAAFIFDLRLLGRLPELPVSRAVASLTRWARWSLLLVVPSGMLLFLVEATSLAMNPSFRLKLLLMLGAGVNAFVFHRFTLPRGGMEGHPAWSGAGPFPWPARLAAVLSILLWFSVLATGRLIAYV